MPVVQWSTESTTIIIVILLSFCKGFYYDSMYTFGPECSSAIHAAVYSQRIIISNSESIDITLDCWFVCIF